MDPDLCTLEALQNHNGRWLLLTVLENDDAVGQPPFDATTFPLSDLRAD